MQTFNNILYNPYVPGHFLLEPIHAFAASVSGEVATLNNIFKEASILSEHWDFIPTKTQPTVVIRTNQLIQLQIKNDGTSNRMFLKNQRFDCEEVSGNKWRLTLIKSESSSEDTSYEKVLWDEFLQHAVELVKKVAIAFFCTPVIPFVFAAGIITKGSSLYFGPSLTRRSLIVKECVQDDYPATAKLARTWQRISHEKCAQARLNDPKKAALFDQAATISKLAAECMEVPEQCSGIFDQTQLAVDEQERVQAMALTKVGDVDFHDPIQRRDYIKLAHLVTHPRNIRSSVNDMEFERVEGAASSLIHSIAIECLRKNKAGIYAEVTHVSKGFYKKLGFEEIPKESVTMFEEFETPMVLTAQKILALEAF